MMTHIVFRRSVHTCADAAGCSEAFMERQNPHCCWRRLEYGLPAPGARLFVHPDPGLHITIRERTTCSQTLYDKIWMPGRARSRTWYLPCCTSTVSPRPRSDQPAKPYEGLRMTGRTVRRPDQTIARARHNVRTTWTAPTPHHDPKTARSGCCARYQNAKESGCTSYPVSDVRSGASCISLARNRLTCPHDCVSATSATRRHMGRVARWPTESAPSEVEHVLGRNARSRKKSKNMKVEITRQACHRCDEAKGRHHDVIGETGHGGWHRLC